MKLSLFVLFWSGWFRWSCAEDEEECGTCQSFGLDFTDGGSFFQNSDSADPFTALQQFSGCADDTANNVLVDPNGDQFLCTDTPLTPDNTSQLTTCPQNKNELFDGDWSIIVISNNGDCDPIAFQRDFFLSVGPQSTVEVAPTVTVEETTTPVSTVMSTVTETITQAADSADTPSMATVTRAKATILHAKQMAHVASTARVEVQASCTPTRKHAVSDHEAHVVPTVLPQSMELPPQLAAVAAESAANKFKRAIIAGEPIPPSLRARYVQERKRSLALHKRSPDVATTTVTDEELPPITFTTTITAPTTTITVPTTVFETITMTSIASDSRGRQRTDSAPRSTRTKTIWIPTTDVNKPAQTQNVVMSVTQTVAAAGASALCALAGGSMD